MPKTLLLKNADFIVTMDRDRRELKSAWILIGGGKILKVGQGRVPERPYDEVVDLSGRLVTPGLVNTHHHMFQSLTRAVPAAQNSSLFAWLQALSPMARDWMTASRLRLKSACAFMPRAAR